MGRFFILCVGVVMDTQMGGRPAGKRQTGVCRSPEVLTNGDLPRGMKRSGINPSAATKIQTVRMGGFNFIIYLYHFHCG
jgi:hypothetical protein